MRRVLTTVLAVALLLGLGALAVLALPNGGAPLAGAPAVSAAAPEFNPDAPLATQNYNMIAMPLNSANQFTNAGYAFNADGLAKLVGSSVQQVLRWNATNQSYEFWQPAIQDGVNFDLQVGGSYWLLVDSTSPTVVSFVGDVPAQGTPNFSLVGDAGTCKYNQISVRLDQSSVTNADQLATAIGDVKQVLNWNAASQSYEFWDPTIQDGVNFSVKIGYPYTVCMQASKTW